MVDALIQHRAVGGQILAVNTAQRHPFFYLTDLPLGNAIPARGGMPIIFPQFAHAGTLVKHGFVRTLPWQLLTESRHPGRTTVSYSLTITPQLYPAWPYSASLLLLVQVTNNQLVVQFKVRNLGNDSFGWTGGLHPYWYVGDLLNTRAQGLADNTVIDFDGSVVERLYSAANQPVVLQYPGAKLQLEASGFNEWMLWTPGRDGASALPDLPEGHWSRFICIEPVCVSQPVHLLPGESFVGQLTAQIFPTAERRSQA